MYNNYNPYYQQPRYNQPIAQPIEQPQYIQPAFTKTSGLQGKQVDSLEVVKATDVPFDGSISYFPLTDNSAIITKQLTTDGTSKIVVFKPIEEEKETKRYITNEELQKAIKGLNLDEIEDIKEELKDIKKQLKKKED